jgi:hypothetical protein
MLSYLLHVLRKANRSLTVAFHAREKSRSDL